MAKETIIEVNDLKKHYGNVKAVDGISFKVLKGEVFTLLGPNGAGKTTTLEVLEGLKTHDSGRITMFGKTLRTNVPREIRERIGVVLQENNFIEHLTVTEILKMFRNLYPSPLKIEEVLDIASLQEKRRARVEKLSGGQRQRLAIGTALVGNPDLIFMDEPTTGLDPQARRNIWDMIERFRNSGKTIFLTTHYMEEAEVLSDYVYIMDHGKIIAKGTPQKLVSSFGGDKIIEARINTNNDKLTELKEIFGNIEIEESKVIFGASDLPRTMKSFLDWAEANSIEVEDLSVRQSNLEDVFLKLTGRSLRD